MPLIFEVLDAETGVFVYPDDGLYDAVLADFDGLLHEHESGQLSDKRYLAALAGDHGRARTVFEEEAYGFPPYFYELALCCMLNDDWVAAATALRRGFAANPYIAEILAGNPNPVPLAIWHSTH
jgi:hypothetical protein